MQTGSVARVMQRRKDRRGSTRVALPVPRSFNGIVEVAVLVPREQVVKQNTAASENSS